MTSERDRLNQIIDQHGLNIAPVHPMELREQSYARVCNALAAKLAEVTADTQRLRGYLTETHKQWDKDKARAEAAEAALKTARPTNPLDDPRVQALVGVVAKSVRAIDELNTFPPDGTGHKWRKSDLIDQEIMTIRAALAPFTETTPKKEPDQ